MSFSEKEMAKAFGLIEEKYFRRNFGTMSKADFETLIFHIYIEHLLDNGLPFDDYTMSKQLGISQAKIRNLKIRKELQYPREGFKWKKAFVDSLKNAYFDGDSKIVKICISDVNVLTELRYFIEKNGWYDEYQLNPKLFQCRIDFFVELCQKLFEEKIEFGEEQEKKLEELKGKLTDKKETSAINKILNGACGDGIKDLLLSASKEVTIYVLRQIPFGGVFSEIVKFLISAIEKS